jgi:hypothetical protein
MRVGVCATAASLLVSSGILLAQTPLFYPDDPIWTMPAPLPVKNAKLRKVGDVYDLFYSQFAKPGEHHTAKTDPISARGVNTLGEVPDGEWYVNRHYRRRLSLTELEQGPVTQPPSRQGKWTVVAAKTEGVTPGFTVVDSTGRRFVVKFDPVDYPELATAADVIGSRFFHALGYHVPENHIVFFERDDLVLGDDTNLVDSKGRKRKMTHKDLWDVLGAVHMQPDGRYRAAASLYLSGKPVGPRRWHGTRRDDPNDIVPHEHRRDLRGMRVFAAWLGHDDSRSINSLDMLVDEGVPHLRHYLIDFGSTLGSASSGPNSPRSGHVPFFSWKQSAQEFFTLGLYVPKWSLAKYPNYTSVGRFEYERFDPERWAPEYWNPAFENMLPDDAFWAARQVAAFTDDEIRAAVRAGQLSDAKAEQWLIECLIQRRNKIARTFLPKLLPIDRFRVDNGNLTFDEIGLQKNNPSQYGIRWFRTKPNEEERTINTASGRTLPVRVEELSKDELLLAHISTGDLRTVRVYIRARDGNPEVVGLRRTWASRTKSPTKETTVTSGNLRAGGF